MKHLLLFLFLFPFVTNILAQQGSLIVAEYRNDSSSSSYTYVISYNFSDGKFTSKDTIFGAPVFQDNWPGSYVRFEFYGNCIYQNRYLISSIGNVIDLKSRTLLVEDSYDFIGLKGDSLFFYQDDVFRTGYLIYKLKKKKLKRIKEQKFRNIEGIIDKEKIVDKFRQRGNTFFVSGITDSIGRRITYKGEPIGKLWCFRYHSLFNEHYFATEWGKVGKALGYNSTQGFYSWNSITKKWIKIASPNLCAIIGWIEE